MIIDDLEGSVDRAQKELESMAQMEVIIRTSFDSKTGEILYAYEINDGELKFPYASDEGIKSLVECLISITLDLCNIEDQQ